MAMASFAPCISRRLLLPFLLSARPPAPHCLVFSGGLLQLHRHPSPASSSSCRKQPQLVPGTDAEEEGVAEQQGKKVALALAVARKQPAAALKAPRPSAPKKPTKGRPAKPGKPPKEGPGGNGGIIHSAPAYSSGSSSSRRDGKKVE
jgi:hypothetical protein